MSKIRMSGLASGLDTESIVKELMSAQRMKSTKLQNKITKLEWKQDKWKEVNTKIYSLYTGPLAKMKMQGVYNTKMAASSDETKLTATAGVQTPEGTHSINVISVASAEYVTGTEISSTQKYNYSTKLVGLAGDGSLEMAACKVNITVGKDKKVTPITIDTTTTIGDIVSKLQDAGLNANFDIARQRFFISAKDSGIDNRFSIKTDGTTDNLAKLGLCNISAADDGNVTIEPNTSLVKATNAKDAIIEYNEAKITSSTNNIAVNGLNINVKDVTTSAIKITVSKDTQAIYDSVKSFLKSYNEVLKVLNDNYDAETAKGYEPLTDDEKEAMSDDQVEKWETKIKDSLLRRDENVNGVIRAMRSMSEQNVKVNGKTYSLASFGITSTIYTEKGLLHIDGDKDDTLTSGNTDKLMKAITENPDAVMETCSNLAKNLYSTMSEKMKGTTLRSALTFYNDKDMKKQVTSYKEDLDDLEDKLEDMETRYYKQFTAMETAMSNMNAQQSSLSSLLGTSSS